MYEWWVHPLDIFLSFNIKFYATNATSYSSTKTKTKKANQKQIAISNSTSKLLNMITLKSYEVE